MHQRIPELFLEFNNCMLENKIDKVIHYFLLAANQNNPKVQCNLGVIYYTGKYLSIFENSLNISSQNSPS